MDQARRSIIDAATRCFSRKGVRRTTMVEIAREAGVSRQTLYNHAATGKDGIIADVIVDEGRRVNQRARRRLKLDRRASELIVDAQVELVLSARRSRYADFLLGGGALDVTAGVIDRSQGVADVMAEYWMPILERLRDAGELRPGLDLEQTVQWLTFVHVALVSQPDVFRGEAEQTREVVRSYVVPGLVPDS